MPQFAIPALLSGALNVAAIAAFEGLAYVTLASFLVPVTVTLVGGFLLSKLAPRVDPQGLDLTGAAARTIRGAVLPARWVLGRARVAGALVWFHEDDRDLHLIYALAQGPCDTVEDIWINGQPGSPTITGDAHSLHGASLRLGSSDYAGSGIFQAQLYLSGSGFASLPQNFAGVSPLAWTAQHQMTGVAWAYVRLHQPEYGTDLDDRVWAGIPEITWLVRGLRIRWPGQSTETWTENAAALRYWWLTERRGIPPDQIDRTLFDAAYSVCDQDIALDGLDGFGSEYPATTKRYSLNGVLTSGEQPESVEAQMDAAWAGFSVEFDGVHRFLPGAERAATVSIGPDDIIQPPTFRPGPEQHERVNQLSARIGQSNLDRWTERVVGPVDDTDAQARDGELLQSDLGTLQFVADPVQALNLITIQLRRERAVAHIDLALAPGIDFRNLTLASGDVATLTLPEWGIDAGRYMVVSSEVEEDWSVRVSLVEQPAGLYADTLILPPLENTFIAPPQPTDPNLPQLAPPVAPGIEYLNDLHAAVPATAPRRVRLSWEAVVNAQGYQFQFQPVATTSPVDSAWCDTASVTPVRAAWQQAQGGDFDSPGTYRWWVRAVRLNYRPSDPVEGPQVQAVEALAMPSPVTGRYSWPAVAGAVQYQYDLATRFRSGQGGIVITGRQSLEDWSSTTATSISVSTSGGVNDVIYLRAVAADGRASRVVEHIDDV